MEAAAVTRRELDRLLAVRGAACASVYLSTRCGNGNRRRVPIVLKNAATAFVDRMIDGGMRASEARAAASPLVELGRDEPFWIAQGEGVGVFLCGGELRALRLRHEPENAFWIDARFHILPLLRPEETEAEYRLLAVSSAAATLYAGSCDGLQIVPVENMPHGMTAALGLDQSTALVQVMTTPVGTVFHGQGGEIDRHKDELRNYFRRIDRALQPVLSAERCPLVFAGVDYLFPIYREVNSYPQLSETPLAGNPERLGAAELHRRAEVLLEPLRRRATADDLRRFEASVGSRRTVERLRDVLAAAHTGAVDTLFISAGESVRGRYDVENGKVFESSAVDDAGGTDLLDLAAFQTLNHGGCVRVVAADEVPHGATAAALLRYPWYGLDRGAAVPGGGAYGTTHSIAQADAERSSGS